MTSPAEPGRVAAEGPPPTELRAARAMGSPLRLQVATGPSAAIVDAAWSAVLDEFEATEQALSRFRDTSEIHRLRLAGGHAEAPSRRLVAALVAADRARRLTDGRFDPRVLLDLERLGSVPLPVPAVEPVHAAAARAGSPLVPRPCSNKPILARSGRRGPIEVPRPVDFGGIGKGLALRWAAARAAAALGAWPFLIEAGGDVVGRGRPGAHGWRVGIEDPRGGEALLAVVELPPFGGAIATSSVRRARWLAPDGRTVHHLIDPATGEPGGEGLLAVTVAAADPAWAEVWSKSLFLEGQAGIDLVARRRDLATWWVSAEGELRLTPRARQLTAWVAGEA